MRHRTLSTKMDFVVVLVCILFLIANIAAVGQAGRKRAQEALCLSNLMKWGQVLHAFTSDNGGYFQSRPVGTIEGYRRLWPYVYKPYYIDKMMRFCPTATNPALVWGPFGTWNYNFGSYRPLPNIPMEGEREFSIFDGYQYLDGHFTGSYGFNRFIENMGGSYTTDPAYWRRAGYKNAGEAPVLIDSQYLYFFASATAPPPDYDGDYSNEMQFQCINRHTGFVNACFLDFSARKVGLKELWTLKYSRTFDTCGPWTTCGGVEPNDWPQWMRDFQDY